MSEFRVLVVLPTYHNARTLPDVLERVRQGGWDILVVNDGCQDATAEILDTWNTRCAEEGGAGFFVLAHESNQGKAAAMLHGFEFAEQHSYTHVVTIDTDGQHDPEEIPQLVNAAKAHPLHLILGQRDDQVEGGTPFKSLIGRRLSNMLIRLGGGIRVTDSQTGFRVYPAKMARVLGAKACRFGFETEILVRLGRAGGQVSLVPITSRYFPASERVSHFRPVIDTLRSMRMHSVLFYERLAWWRRIRWPG